MNLTNIDCVGQDDLCKVESPKNSETPMTNNDICKTGDYKELDYTESDNKSHDNSNHGIFCVSGKDSDCIDIDELF